MELRAHGGVLVLASLAAGCLIRDTGWREERTGVVDEGTLCEGRILDEACPPCSSTDEGVCRDRWYASAARCFTDAQCAAVVGTCQQGYCVSVDEDEDGLDDRFEQELAERNLPVIFADSNEGCGHPKGMLFRAQRLANAPGRIALLYIVLYNRDCGELNGHVGDNEPLALTVVLDARPGAAATVAIETRAHGNTSCESVSSCVTLPGTGACGAPAPPDWQPVMVLFAARNKHSHYLRQGTCERNCFDACGPGERFADLPLVNVGEPEHPLVDDLSTQAFVNVGAGWGNQLLHSDPWGEQTFGGAGYIRKQLLTIAAPAGL